MKKLMISSQESLRLVPCSDIMYCKSDSCYTNVYLIDGDELIVCKSLKKLSLEIDSLLFIRVNQSYLVNKEYIKIIDKKNKTIELKNTQRIPFTISISELVALIIANIQI